MQHSVVIFDFTATPWLFFSFARATWSDALGKVLNTARMRQKDAKSAPCVRKGRRDAHTLPVRASDKTATFWDVSARVCGISDRSGLFRPE